MTTPAPYLTPLAFDDSHAEEFSTNELYAIMAIVIDEFMPIMDRLKYERKIIMEYNMTVSRRIGA